MNRLLSHTSTTFIICLLFAHNFLIAQRPPCRDALQCLEIKLEEFDRGGLHNRSITTVKNKCNEEVVIYFSLFTEKGKRITTEGGDYSGGRIGPQQSKEFKTDLLYPISYLLYKARYWDPPEGFCEGGNYDYPKEGESLPNAKISVGGGFSNSYKTAGNAAGFIQAHNNYRLRITEGGDYEVEILTEIYGKSREYSICFEMSSAEAMPRPNCNKNKQLGNPWLVKDVQAGNTITLWRVEQFNGPGGETPITNVKYNHDTKTSHITWEANGLKIIIKLKQVRKADHMAQPKFLQVHGTYRAEFKEGGVYQVDLISATMAGIREYSLCVEKSNGSSVLPDRCRKFPKTWEISDIKQGNTLTIWRIENGPGGETPLTSLKSDGNLDYATWEAGNGFKVIAKIKQLKSIEEPFNEGSDSAVLKTYSECIKDIRVDYPETAGPIPCNAILVYFTNICFKQQKSIVVFEHIDGRGVVQALEEPYYHPNEGKYYSFDCIGPRRDETEKWSKTDYGTGKFKIILLPPETIWKPKFSTWWDFTHMVADTVRFN